MLYQVAKQRALKEQAKRSQTATPASSPTQSGTATPTSGAQTPVYAGSIKDKYDDEKSEKKETDMKAVEATDEPDFKLSITDVNPIRPIRFIVKQKTNLCILSASGACFLWLA